MFLGGGLCAGLLPQQRSVRIRPSPSETRRKYFQWRGAWRNPKIAGYVHDDTETRTGKPKGPMEGCHAVIGKIPHPR